MFGILRLENLEDEARQQNYQQQWQPIQSLISQPQLQPFQPQLQLLQPASLPVYISPYANFNEAAERSWRITNHEALMRKTEECATLKQKLAETHAQVQDYALQLQAMRKKENERAKRVEWMRAARGKKSNEAAMRKEARLTSQTKKVEKAKEVAIRKEARLTARAKKAEEVAMRKEAQLTSRTKKAEDAAMRKEAQLTSRTKKAEEAAMRRVAQRRAKKQAIRQKTTNENTQQSYATQKVQGLAKKEQSI
ncbi:hypothetical protein VE02_01814 [Pseudogymnoascus sp. 03VT05]|nr:hypothetical protein VE02_01814 [Pseudogymnoascus sp. 03VT05]